MMSTTTRYPIKPKNLTLLELSQSFGDFRYPPASKRSYQYKPPPNTTQILTRRLYLHPLTINPSAKQQLPKISASIVASPDSEQRYPLNFDKNGVTRHTKNKSSHPDLTVLSSSFPLLTRINPKSDTRYFRDKGSIHSDDINSDYDASTTSTTFNQTSLPSLTRGTLSSTHTKCTRPSHITNRRETSQKPNRLEKLNVWHHLQRTLQRPIPLDPPTTPFNPPTTPYDNVSEYNTENDEPQNQFINYNSIQEIKIYKRNPIRKSFIGKDNDYENYFYNEQ